MLLVRMPSSGIRRVALARTRFGGTYSLHHQGDKNWRARNNVSSNYSVLRLLATVNIVPSSPILVTLMMEAIRSSEKSVPTRATRRNIPEDGILYSHRSDNLKSYTVIIRFHIYYREKSF
jgi:hypothetical protein